MSVAIFDVDFGIADQVLAESNIGHLRTMIAKAVATERERCAMVAQETADRLDREAVELYKKPGEGRKAAASTAASEIADAIRGLSATR